MGRLSVTPVDTDHMRSVDLLRPSFQPLSTRIVHKQTMERPNARVEDDLAQSTR
jgi:hypothetical protein